jgi:hypothetical protein
MALTEPIQLYRGTHASLVSLASSGHQGVMLWTTDTNEVYVDSGTGSGIGTAWLRIANNVSVQIAANQAARLALTANIGDIVLQTDTSTTYILTASPASTNGNWTAIGLSTAPVTSVNGHTGAVALTFSDFTGQQITQSQLPSVIDCGTF